jgi:hypothetical protein
MIEIEKPSIDIVELSEDDIYGRFVVEPLERGYGTTWGILCGGYCFLPYRGHQWSR